MQAPDHRHRHDQDPQIGEGADPRGGEVERHDIDACPVEDALVPEEGYRGALEEVREEHRHGQR